MVSLRMVGLARKFLRVLCNFSLSWAVVLRNSSTVDRPLATKESALVMWESVGGGVSADMVVVEMKGVLPHGAPYLPPTPSVTRAIRNAGRDIDEGVIGSERV